MIDAGPDEIAAFRLARHGLDARRPLPLAAVLACPASDFQRGSVLLALGARAEGVTREGYDRAVDDGSLVIAPSLRAAIHAVAPADVAVYGRALVAADDTELGEQLGAPAARQLKAAGVTPSAALEEVARATAQAVSARGALTKDELHDELRGRVQGTLLPWCEGCASHHVAPMLWRYGCVVAGARLDAQRRYVAGEAAAGTGAAQPHEAARRFLRFYGPATQKDFVAWAGVARAHGRRLWEAVAGELVEVRVDGRRLWLLEADADALASPPEPRGVRLLPPRDPYLQHPDRASVVPDPALRKRVHRPVSSPGAVLQDGQVAGLWRVRARGKRAEIAIETVGIALDREALAAEADRVAALRGAASASVVVS
ncbi:MAG TPA: winged helix DNA-binding domain-containing protein [Solirubrobacteraceae bacterium]|jgi:hypothetical protein